MSTRAEQSWPWAVPRKNGLGRWWVRIIATSDCGNFVKVAGCKAAGAPWWVRVTELKKK